VHHNYLLNRKAYELQTRYIDGVRRPVSPTSAMTSKVKGQGQQGDRKCIIRLRDGKAYELQNWYADGACYQLPRPVLGLKAYEVRFLHAVGGIPCRPNPAATNLLTVVCILGLLAAETGVHEARAQVSYLVQNVGFNEPYYVRTAN